jgi:hypothetical protein
MTVKRTLAGVAFAASTAVSGLNIHYSLNIGKPFDELSPFVQGALDEFCIDGSRVRYPGMCGRHFQQADQSKIDTAIHQARAGLDAWAVFALGFGGWCLYSDRRMRRRSFVPNT